MADSVKKINKYVTHISISVFVSLFQPESDISLKFMMSLVSARDAFVRVRMIRRAIAMMP